MHKDSCIDRTPLVVQDPDARDRELLRRLQEDDAAALEEALASYWTPLLEYVLRIVGSVDGAEDVVQEAFIELWSRRMSCHTSVRAYLYRSARNMALNKRRGREVRSRLAVRVLRDGKEKRPPTPEEVFDGRVLEEAMAEALANLPERRREVFQLVRYHGMSYREVAEVMEISTQTVANQMSAALATLRRALVDRAETGEMVDPDRSSV